MTKQMMSCGHAANATHILPDGSEEPTCVICLGIRDVHPVEGPDLTDRKARCSYYSMCRREVPSSTSLAFFSHHPEQPYDGFYCGCFGWD